MQKTGAEIIMECLLEQNVDTVFGYPGGAVLNIYDALYQYSDRIHHILTAHEQGASHAADGYARASGKTGVVIATSGPGATNLVTGLATAYMDSVPVVAITGNVAVNLLGRDSFQEVDITGITMPVTKHNFIVKDVNELADTIRKAFLIAGTGRKGPVLIDIPKDVTAAKAEYVPVTPEQPAPMKIGKPERLRLAAEMIENAKRPLIYAGGGVISAECADALRELVERCGIPVIFSMMGLDALPATHPLNLGMVGMHGTVAANRAAHECDCLLVVGARFSDRVAGKRESFAGGARIIHIDADSAEFDKNVHSELHIRGDAGLALEGILSYLSPGSYPDWLEQIRGFWNPCKPMPVSKDEIRPRNVINTAAKLAPNAVIVTDVGQHQMWVAQCFPFSRPRTFLTSGGLGTMGYGLGASIGASLANPDSRVILFSGDGSFHMNLTELATLVSYQIPVVVIIMNNQVLGMVRQWQKAFYKHRFSATDPERKTDFVKLAEAFGVHGMRMERPEDVEPVLRQALSLNAPVVIDCRISKDANVLPMIPPGGDVSDIITEMEGVSCDA